MIRRPLLVACTGALFLLAGAADAQPPEPAADPLPEGALVRFGVTRPLLRGDPGIALLPPRYTNFLAPTMTGGVRRYDLGTGRPLDKDAIAGPGHVTVSADGKRAAVALPGSLRVVDVATGKTLRAVAPPAGVILAGTPSVALSADGKVLAYGGKGQERSGEVVVLDVDQNEVLAQCTTEQAAPVHVCLSADGRTVVSHGPPARPPDLSGSPKPVAKPASEPDELRTAQVWEVASGRELFKARVTGMGGNVVAAALAPDGAVLAVSAGDGPVDIFEVKTGKRLRTLLGRKTQGLRVTFSPDGTKLATVGLDYRIARWLVDGTPLDITEPPAGLYIGLITGLQFADSERVIASMTTGQLAYAWDAPTGSLLSPAYDHANGIRSIAFPPSGKDVLSSGHDGKAYRWDLATGALSEEIALRPARIPGEPLLRPHVQLSADGSRAMWFRGPIAEVFDVGTGENLFVVPPPSAPPAPVKFSLSPDGLRVAALCRQGAGQRTGRCVVWDLRTQQRLAELDTPSLVAGSNPAAVFSPDGTRVVIVAFAESPQGGRALMLSSHDLKTGQKLAQLEDPAAVGSITMAALSETTLVAASSTGRLWTIDYVKGQVGGTFDTLVAPGEAPVHGPIAVSPDGKRFALGVTGAPFSSYGVRIYDTATRKPLHTFLGHVGPISALYFRPDGNAIASGAQDTSVLLWDLRKLPGEK